MYAPTLQLPRALVFKILNKSKPEHIWMRLKTPDAGTLLSFFSGGKHTLGTAQQECSRGGKARPSFR